MERILAIARVVTDQSQVELVVAGQEQRRVDRHGELLAPCAIGRQPDRADDFAVEHHHELAEIRQQRRRPGKRQRQVGGGNDFVGAQAERDRDLAPRSRQPDRAADTQILQRQPFLADAACRFGCGYRHGDGGVLRRDRLRQTDGHQHRRCGQRSGRRGQAGPLATAFRAIEPEQALQRDEVDDEDVAQRSQRRDRLAWPLRLPGVVAPHHGTNELA